VDVPTTAGDRAGRAQSGLDRLLLFVLAVVILVLVSPHVLGLAGVDVGAEPAAPPAADADHDLLVLEARGTAIQDGTIGAVRLVVTPSPDRVPVDLGAQMAIWAGDRSYYLGPGSGSGEGFDGGYRAGVIDGPGQVLDSRTARGELVFDLGETDDVSGVPEFGSRLEPGETVAVTIVTPHGETRTRRLTVPDAVGGDSVAL